MNKDNGDMSADSYRLYLEDVNLLKELNEQYFHYIIATSFSGGRSRSTRREPPTMDKQLINFITCGCESSALVFVIYKAGRKPTPSW
jgi:hypothetical protein